MTESKKLKFAIVGAGAIASHHILALQQISGAEVSHVCRRDETKVQELAQNFNILGTTNYQDLLKNPDINVIDITLPSGLHAEFGIQAAQAGKHVIVEKPIDVTLKKADALIKACKDNGVALGVISQMRFTDDMLKLYDYVSTGRFGKLIQGDAYIKWYRSQKYYNSGAWRGTWALDGGGPFINQGIHFIDLLLSVMGPAKWVSAKTRNVSHDIEVEDIGMAMVEFKNGAHGVIQAATTVLPGLPARLEIHGTKGTIIFEGDRISFLYIQGEQPCTVQEVDKGGASDSMAINVTPFVREFEDIIAAIHEKREPKVSGREARKSLQLILAIYESSKTGKPVVI